MALLALAALPWSYADEGRGAKPLSSCSGAVKAQHGMSMVEWCALIIDLEPRELPLGWLHWGSVAEVVALLPA